MLILDHHIAIFSYPLFLKKRSRSCSTVALAIKKKKKKKSSEDSTSTQQPSSALFKVSNKSLAQSAAIGVLTLGFIDAGYSGDWSRIGAISKETEDLLKVAAFVVVPFCLFLVFRIYQKLQD